MFHKDLQKVGKKFGAWGICNSRQFKRFTLSESVFAFILYLARCLPANKKYNREVLTNIGSFIRKKKRTTIIINKKRGTCLAKGCSKPSKLSSRLFPS